MATVAGLAGIAGAIPYGHMRQLTPPTAKQAGTPTPFPCPWTAWRSSHHPGPARRAGRKSGWLPWAALTIGTAASLAANIAIADHGTVSRVIAGWPALALLIAVKLLSAFLEHRDIAAAMVIADATEPGTASAVPSGLAPDAGGLPVALQMSRTAHVPDSDRPRRRLSRPAARIDDLLQAACAVRDELRTDGRPLTRDALAARLRTTGHRVGNDRLTPLLAALRDTPVT